MTEIYGIYTESYNRDNYSVFELDEGYLYDSAETAQFWADALNWEHAVRWLDPKNERFQSWTPKLPYSIDTLSVKTDPIPEGT